MRSVFVVDTLTVNSQVALLLGGGGLMCRIKIPQQDFVLKIMQVGLMREGGVFAGHYGIINPVSVFNSKERENNKSALNPCSHSVFL